MILAPARIEDADTRPRSVEFGDIYFARDGARETERVFIEPMRLRALFGDAPASGVRLGELGFGTGLNFLAVSQAFLDAAPETARLDYIAFEKHPLARADLEKILRRHARGLRLAQALANAWPHRLEGWHTRYFANGRIRLLLYQGDALAGMSDLQGRCQAWLLDGFDPRCNPEMWRQALMTEVARKSAADARIASFTSQGAVRRRLESVGFAMQKVDQQPHKRHSLVGRLASAEHAETLRAREVAVVGAGFAGSFTAHLLAIRGINVHLLDRGAQPLPAALAHARLGDPGQALSQLRALARGYSNDWYRRLGASSGVLEAPVDARTLEKAARDAEYWAAADPALRLIDRAEAEEKSALPGIRQSLWHACCHTVEPWLLDRLTDHARITRRVKHVLACQPEGADWKLTLADGASLTFARVVICAGAGTLTLVPELDARVVGGQMERVTAPTIPACAMVGQGFAIPGRREQLTIGATFEHTPLGAEEATQENIRRAEDWFGALGRPVVMTRTASWRGKRLYRRDRRPIIQEIAAGLYLNCAYGASGSLLAPLGAELVASQIAADPLPITRTLMTESIASM